MIEEITMFKTSDGQVHATIKEAKLQEAKIELSKHLFHILKNNFSNVDEYDCNNVAGEIIRDRFKIVETLQHPDKED